MAEEDEEQDVQEEAPAEEPEGDGEEGDEGEDGEKKPKKGSKKKRLIIALAIVLLLVAGGAGAYFSGLLGGGSDHEEAAVEVEGQPVYFDIPQLLVNLNTENKSTSFIKTTITLQLNSAEDVAYVEANLPRLMDSYNTFLREMRVTDLYGSAGVYRLREEMLVRANAVLAPVVVKDVLFRELLVQ